MGAIVSDLTELPSAEGPGLRRAYRKIYDELVELSESEPAQPDNSITRDQLRDALRLVIGNRVKNEIANDPKNMNYAGKTDAQQAALLNDPFSLLGRRVDKTPVMKLSGAVAVAGTVLSVVKQSDGSAIDLSEHGNNLPGKLLRFRNNTTTVALQGLTFRILSNTANTVTIANGGLPVAAAVDDVVLIEETDPTLFSSRLHQVLRRVPHTPNMLTTADITAAKV